MVQISLKGKKALITGAGAGMGRTTALAMQSMGAHVFTCDVDSNALDSLPSEIETFVCDVADSKQVDAMFDQILPLGLDVLVNNAGIAGPTKPVEDINDEEWSRCLNVSLDSQFFCSRRAVPGFKQQGSGVIINLISAGGIMGYPNRTPYAAAKWASTGLTKTLAMELGPHNIRVNGIVPGNVAGDRMDQVVAAHAAADEISEDQVRHLYAISTSMQCYVDPEEVANMICFLCSDLGKHISGQIIGIDGNTETLYPRS